MPAAAILTSTSSALGGSMSTSSMLRGCWYALRMAAFAFTTSLLHWLAWELARSERWSGGRSRAVGPASETILPGAPRDDAGLLEQAAWQTSRHRSGACS